MTATPWRTSAPAHAPDERDADEVGGYMSTVARVPVVNCLRVGDDPHLVVQECVACGARYLEARDACAGCSGRSLVARRAAATGTLRAFSIVYQSMPLVETPFVAALVDLDDGTLVAANLRGGKPDPAEVAVGMRVRLVTFVAGVDAEGAEAIAFAFTPDAS